MTASRRYLPLSLACLVTLSAASAAMAAGGSALDPYASVSAPTSLKGTGKNDKGKKAHHVPIMKKAAAEEKIVQDESTQSQTYVKLPGGSKSKHVKDTEEKVAAQPKAKKGLGLHLPTFSKAAAPDTAAKTSKTSDLAPAPKTTKVSDVAPAPKATKVSDVAPAATPAKEQKSPKVSAQGEDSVMGGIKTIGEGYSKTFKAASHGVVTSTKAASDAVVAGSKKMGSGIKSGAKASGDALKKGADMVSHGFKATGEKIKDTTAPLTEKLAKSPAPAKAKIAKAEKADKVDKADAADKVEVAKANEKAGKQSFGAKLAHLPKPKLPKIGMPFRGGKKKDSVVVDKQAGASELGSPAAEPDKNVAAAPKPVLQKPIGKYTPIVDDPPTLVQAPDIPKIKEKKADTVKGQKSSLAAMPGNVSKKIGKLWPFGHKSAASTTDVAGKQTQPPM